MTAAVHLIGLSRDDTEWFAMALRLLGVTAHQVDNLQAARPLHSEASMVVLPWSNPEAFAAARSVLLRAGFPDACVALLPNASYRLAVQAVRAAAVDVMCRPLDADDLRDVIGAMQRRTAPSAAVSATKSLAEIEKEAIQGTLSACRGQVALTARRLGIGRSTLYRKIELYGITNAR